jgi:putative PIN family toxin of toxin-antitoxin system
LTLCKYGAACLVRDHGPELIASARQQGSLGGSVAAVGAKAEEEAAALAEVLPYDAPDDIYLVTTHLILDEVHRKLIEKFGHEPAEAATKRFFVATIAARTVPYFEPASVRRYTRDPTDDMVVHTALEGRAEFIVTTDEDLLEDGEGTRYAGENEGQVTVAYSLERFGEMLETSKFSLSDVPEVLALSPGDRPSPAS